MPPSAPPVARFTTRRAAFSRLAAAGIVAEAEAVISQWVAAGLVRDYGQMIYLTDTGLTAARQDEESTDGN